MNIWELHYSMTDQEHFAFNEHYLLKTPGGRKILLRYRLLAPIIFYPMLIVAYINDGNSYALVVRFCIFTIVSVLMCFFAHKVSMAFVKRRIKKEMKTSPDEYDREVCSVFDFENRTIKSISKKEEVKVNFDSVDIVYEYKKAFYLYYKQNRAYVLTFSAFQSEDELMTFRGLLQENFSFSNK